jgi:nickel-dependent lactate racemase
MELRYGSERLPSPWHDGESVAVLLPRDVPVVPDPRADVEQSLRLPLDSPPLEQLARSAHSAVILVSGADRVTRADLFMPPLLAALRRGGLPPERTRILVATGTHVPFTPADLQRVTGFAPPCPVAVEGHDCKDHARLIEIGRTSSGNLIRVNRVAYEADLKILTGRITHHYFAGFTGGRKAVLPGVCAYDTIRFNHKLVLSGTGGRPVHPGARNGCLDENPVHRDMIEAARLFRASFVLNTVLSTAHELIGVFAGDVFAAHRTGCWLADEVFAFRTAARYDLAVASCGGEPYDVSFIQAIKTIFNCHRAVRDGGVFLLLAACPQGIRDGFLRWTQYQQMPQLALAVRAKYDLTAHNYYLLREVLGRIHIVLVSQCPPQDVERLGFIRAPNLAEGWRRARDVVGRARPSTCAIPFGNITVLTE